MLVVIGGLPAVPVLIQVDTLARNFGNGSENDSQAMNSFVESLSRLRAITGACVQVVHHTGLVENDRARGSSALRAALDTEMALKPKDGGIQLECTKQKDAMEFVPVGLELEVVPMGFDDDGEEITSCVVIPSAATEGATLAQQLMAGQRVGKNQRHGLEVVRQAVATIQRNEPDRELFCIETKALYDGLGNEIKHKQRRGGVVVWLEESGILHKINSLIYKVNIDALHAALVAG